MGRVGLTEKPFLIGETGGFIASSNGNLFMIMNDPLNLMFDNAGEVEVVVQRYQEGGTAQAFDAPNSPQAAAYTPRQNGTGFYGAEQEIVFNVLESVSFDATTGELFLAGRFDVDLAGPRIPYLQHLAVLLENPGPQVSLDWTPDFERKVESFFSRMDDVQEMASLVGGGELVDSSGRITAKGRLFLPLFGVKAFHHGGAAGSLGVETEFKEFGIVRITGVAPGSAADRAGLRVGNQIGLLSTPDAGTHQPYAPQTLLRSIRFAGAGAEVILSVDGYAPENDVTVTLDAFQGDSWAHVTRYDINSRIFRIGGYSKIANFLVDLDRMLRLQDTQAGLNSMWFLLNTIGVFDWASQARQEVMNGQRSKDAFMNELPRRIVEGMERTLDLPSGSLVDVYDRSRYRSADPWPPLDVAVLELNRLLEPRIKEALRAALNQNDEISMPVAVLDPDSDFKPQVHPRYISIPAHSELARLFIEADYVAKAFLHRPELSEQIPAYQTEYAFSGDRMGRVEETTSRLWIEPARMDVHRSADNGTLRFGRTEMRINIGRAIGGGAERRDEAYGRFLTDLYDELAQEFHPLHELREAAKLAVVGRWIQSQKSGFRLPIEGRARLSPPATLEGFVTLIWSPKRLKVSLIAPGGIDFNVPPIGPSGPVFPDEVRVNVPIDASVVNLKGLSRNPVLRLAPSTLSSIPARYHRPLTMPPIPSSVRLVGLATKGKRTLDRISAIKVRTRIDARRCDADASRSLQGQLNSAVTIARKLHGVEKALNAITAQMPERQRTIAAINKTLIEEEQNLRAGALDLATQGLMGAYDELKGGSQIRSIRDLESLIAKMRQAKSELGEISAKLANFDLAFSSAMASSLNERERAAKGLLTYVKDILSDSASIKGGGAANRALRAAGKTLGVAGKIQIAIDGAESIYRISDALESLERIDAQSEQEVRGLRDSLLPLQRKLSDQLDTVMNDPLVRAYETGSGRFDCGR